MPVPLVFPRSIPPNQILGPIFDTLVASLAESLPGYETQPKDPKDILR